MCKMPAGQPQVFSLSITIKMGDDVARVAERCEQAKQTAILDLSDCRMTAIPQAVFFILKEIELREVDLSKNDIKKLPPKLGFSIAFRTITSKKFLILPFLVE